MTKTYQEYLRADLDIEALDDGVYDAILDNTHGHVWQVEERQVLRGAQKVLVGWLLDRTLAALDPGEVFSEMEQIAQWFTEPVEIVNESDIYEVLSATWWRYNEVRQQYYQPDHERSLTSLKKTVANWPTIRFTIIERGSRQAGTLTEHLYTVLAIWKDGYPSIRTRDAAGVLMKNWDAINDRLISTLTPWQVAEELEKALGLGHSDNQVVYIA